MKNNLHKKPVILSIDDDEDLQAMIRCCMIKRGYDVRISPNGDNLWEIIFDELPDIILMDIQMKSINGDDICRQLKANERARNVPVILLSANDNISFIAAACDADGFIQKPFDADAMDKLIVSLLMRKAA